MWCDCICGIKIVWSFYFRKNFGARVQLDIKLMLFSKNLPTFKAFSGIYGSRKTKILTNHKNYDENIVNLNFQKYSWARAKISILWKNAWRYLRLESSHRSGCKIDGAPKDFRMIFIIVFARTQKFCGARKLAHVL